MDLNELDEYLWRVIEAMKSGVEDAFRELARVVSLLLPDLRKGTLSKADEDRLVKNILGSMLLAAARLTARPPSVLRWMEHRISQERRQWTKWIGDDRERGADLQKRLMQPDHLCAHGAEAAFAMRAFDVISGDFCALLPGPHDLLIAMGDVMGKGTAAGILGSLVLGQIRVLAERIRTPATLLTQLNRRLTEAGLTPEYATLVVARWDPAARRIRVANAGNVAPRIFRGRTLKKPGEPGLPLGLSKDARYLSSSSPAKAGDVLLLFSDGITEQAGIDAAGYELRLQEVLRSCHHHSPRAILEAIWKDFDTFVGANRLTDDQTLVVLKIE
ncbi:MAG: PP2C family protein-serine/threonine phosphatase [Acidobacteriota bacterium]